VDDLTDKAVATLLLSLRFAPTLAFAPPFTLMRVPAIVRLMLAVLVSAWLVAAWPAQTSGSGFLETGLAATAGAEILLGVSLALSLQLAFAALLMAGRAIDIQAGFGLALLLDPTTRTQVPLVGTLLVYATAAIFFATGGPGDLLAIWSLSVSEIPLGAARIGGEQLATLSTFISAVFVMAFGAAGLMMLVLFIIDLAIAFMSRTLPQMNVLLLGFQVKTLATLAILPVAIALSATLFLRLVRYALATAAQLI
jgi:flagellar biosynthesis protein FliR